MYHTQIAYHIWQGTTPKGLFLITRGVVYVVQKTGATLYERCGHGHEYSRVSISVNT